MRWYQDGTALADVIMKKSGEVESLLRGVPGFISYYIIRDGNSVTSITVCQDKAGTDESSRRAAAWVKENMTGSIQPPRISEGDTFLAFSK